MFIPILRSAVSLQLTEFWLVFLNDSTNCVNFLLGLDRSEFRPSLRGLLMDGYIAFYLVETDRIVIVRVIDSRRDIEHELSK